MDDMMDKVEIQLLRKLADEKRQTYLTLLYLIDDLADEILMLDNPESQREVALYMKEILKQAEEVI